MSQTIGPYEVVNRAGTGATSAVFRARSQSGPDVAVKVLVRSSPDALARFERERRLLAELAQEGGIVPILDAGLAREGPYVVMPFIEGGTLRSRLQKGPLAVEATAELGRMLAKTLARCHERGIVHRDLKPENILFDGVRPLVADLGLAKHFRPDALGASKSEALSKTGELRGTPGYSAPEQLRDAKAAGPAADVFALGAILFECLAGSPAFPGTTSFEVYTRMEEGPHEPLDREGVPAYLRSAIGRALERDPSRRPADAGELLKLLAKPAKDSAPRRRLLPFVAGGALLALAAAGAYAGVHLLGPAAPAPPPPPPPVVAIDDYLERAQLLWTRGAFAEAIEQATRAVERAPKDPRGFVRRGRIELDVLEYRTAARDFELAAQLDPSLAIAWAGRAWALGSRVSTTVPLAVQCAERAMKLAPEAPESLMARSIAIRPDEKEASIAAARKAVALAPRDARAHVVLADALGTHGDWEHAIPELEEALRLAPDDPYALTLRALARYWQREGIEVGRAELDRVIARAPRAHLARRLRGDLRAKLSDVEGSLADLRVATQVEPDDPRSWDELGIELMKNGLDEEADAAFLKEIQTGPNRPNGYDNRARLRIKHDDIAGAATDLERVTQLGTKDPAVWSMWASCDIRFARWPEAKEHAEKALELERKHPAAWLYLGEALFHLNEATAARDALDTAIRLEPRNARAWSMRSQTREKLGDLEGAIEDCRQCLDALPPGGPEHDATQARLKHLESRRGR